MSTATTANVPRTLKIVIIEGKELKGLDSGGVSDCFLKFKCNNVSAKTEVIKKTTSPIWKHMISVGPVEDNSLLSFFVMDWERIGTSRPMGKVEIPCLELAAGAKRNQHDQWLRLDTKGFIRVSYEFSPPYPLEVDPAEPPPQSFINQPAVYFKPIYLPTFQTEVVSTGQTTAKFIMPGSVYHSRSFIAGEPVNCSLIINVLEPRIVVRSLNLTFDGSVTFRGKKQRKLVNDYRDLLLGYGELNNVSAANRGHYHKITLERGKHIFPFQFFLDKTCKSTVQMVNGYSVSYGLYFSADIVNQPDIGLYQEIKVVNLEDTVYKMTVSPMNGSASKSPLTGGNISMNAKSVKNSFYPGEEIELEMDINNTSKKKIKAVDIVLQRLDYSGTDTTPLYTNVLTMTKKCYPKIKPNTQRNMMTVIELPNSQLMVPSISETKMTRIEYQLLVNLDIPNCVDLRLKLPVVIVQPDPKLEYLPNALTEIGDIPRYINNWTVRHFHSWVLFKMQCPDVIKNNPEFYQYHLNGLDLMKLNNDTLFNILKGAGPRTQELVSDLQVQIFQIQAVRDLLKELQIPSFIETFEKESITFEILPYLTYNDILSLGLPIGDAKRLEIKIKQINQQQQYCDINNKQ
ncbi:hypothetical protein DICPUDRAFT_152122 [Dictyostelium purpureum]|uniref:C2 domain-containing protein n=1 Tax=Dictyostelium purpureum TaxID=5786 RepID=F0ZKJ1_DICPU|nr:uncharacterized protein DICPUDRAFT_152122 [Dictyostelium purpureum]EGC35565.1 hypothetical protein DICPUDRAFT_152122 [Dictyostelium purpureum]|eukprot:XP_003287936.1 hypothetical protein DICPUDRAFT_152122 [Dictyostelium purpureum]